MAETAPAPAVPTAKAPKKKSSAKARKSGPSVSDLIVKAVAASHERKGMSLAALKKALAGGGYDVEKNNSRVKLALKSLVKKGSLVQTKGTGASGSFKVTKGGAVTKPAKKPAVKAKKPAPKKTATKAAKPKKSPAKKPAAKKAPKKVKKTAAAAAKKAVKSPKKAKKPAAKKVSKSPSKKVKAAKPKAAKPKVSKAKKTSAKKK